MQKIQQALLKHLNRLYNALIFATLFGILGVAVPDVYYRYFDETQYYRINRAVVVDTDTRRCESVEVLFERESQITIQGQAVTKYVLISLDGVEHEQKTENYILTLERGVTSGATAFNLDCGIPKGKYVLKGSVQYYVRGGHHIAEWQTNAFTVE